MRPHLRDGRARSAMPDDTTLPGLLDRHANARAQALIAPALIAPALIVPGGPVSFAELADDARRLAAGLDGLGLVRGDRVALWLPSGRAWLAALVACARLGLVAVAVNTRFRAREVGDILARTGARAVLLRPDGAADGPEAVLAACRPEELAAVERLIVEGDGPTGAGGSAGAGGSTGALSDLGKAVVPLAELMRAAPHDGGMAAPDAPCLVFTTSGTTKAPKFVLHDQARLISHGAAVARACGLTAEKRMLLVAPMCGTYGLATTMAALAVGATLIVLERWDPREAIALAERHGATHAMATDDAVAQILAASDAPRPLPTMECVGLAGVNPALGDIFVRAEARGLNLAGLYGSSELQAIVAMQRPEADRAEREGRGGHTVDPAAEVRASDPETRAVLPDGEAGELEFRVPGSGMIGYLGDAAATAAAFTADGFFRTGDLGLRLPDGRVLFLSRLGDSLRLGGFLVNPAEIEGVVEEVDGVAQAQVVAVDTSAGPRPVAFVILADGAALDETGIRDHVAGRLARFKVPVRVFSVEEFPITVSANATKIQKGKLRDLALALMADA